jgi:hypothetical protein
LRSARALTYLIAVALFAAAGGLEFQRRRTSTRERARFGVLRDDAELFTDALATSLRIPEVCADIFRDARVKPGARRPLELNYAYDPAVPPPLKAGGEAWGGTQLGRLDLTLPEDPELRTVYRRRPLRRFRARIDADFVIRDRFPAGVPGSLEVYLWIDDDDRVRGCFGSLSIGALCNMTGGYYDLDGSKSGSRCHPLTRTSIETPDARAFRGTCRAGGVVSRASDCPGGSKNAIPFQDKVGHGTTKQVLCQFCE